MLGRHLHVLPQREGSNVNESAPTVRDGPARTWARPRIVPPERNTPETYLEIGKAGGQRYK